MSVGLHYPVGNLASPGPKEASISWARGGRPDRCHSPATWTTREGPTLSCAAGSELAVLYNDTAVLESHHHGPGLPAQGQGQQMQHFLRILTGLCAKALVIGFVKCKAETQFSLTSPSAAFLLVGKKEIMIVSHCIRQ